MRYTALVGGGAMAAPGNVNLAVRRMWLRMVNNGTTLVMSFSLDGAIFRTLESVALTAVFTVAPNQMGYFCTPRPLAVSASYLSWTVS
jgi:hypothetical protein